MHRTTLKGLTVLLRHRIALCMCSLAIGCEPLDEGMLGGDGSQAGRDAGAGPSGHDGATQDAAGIGAGGANAGGANAGGATAGGASAGGATAGDGSAGGPGDASAGGSDASSHTSNLDASVSDHDAGMNTIMLGPSMRRDGGPARWDPDAAGPILDPQMQAACLALTDNICNRIPDCRASLAEMMLTDAQRKSGLESCREPIYVAHNCNRAIRTSSDFAMCAESTKTAACTALFLTNFAESCFNKITFQP